jgi:hypothetical protein
MGKALIGIAAFQILSLITMRLIDFKKIREYFARRNKFMDEVEEMHYEY